MLRLRLLCVCLPQGRQRSRERSAAALPPDVPRDAVGDERVTPRTCHIGSSLFSCRVFQCQPSLPNAPLTKNSTIPLQVRALHSQAQGSHGKKGIDVGKATAAAVVGAGGGAKWELDCTRCIPCAAKNTCCCISCPARAHRHAPTCQPYEHVRCVHRSMHLSGRFTISIRNASVTQFILQNVRWHSYGVG